MSCWIDGPQGVRSGVRLAKGSANDLRPKLSLERNRDAYRVREGEQPCRGSLEVTMFREAKSPRHTPCLAALPPVFLGSQHTWGLFLLTSAGILRETATAG